MMYAGRPTIPQCFRHTALAILSTAAVTTAALFIASPQAQAGLSPELKCHRALTDGARKGVELILRARADCLESRLKGKLGAGIDCLADTVALGGGGTGDAKTDSSLDKILKFRDRQIVKIPKKCDGIDLAVIGVDDICNPPSIVPAEVGVCAVIDLGKAQADIASLILDVPQPLVAPPSGALKCFGQIGSALRFNIRKLNRRRRDCFKDNEKAGGTLECLATIAPPGIANTTNSTKIDEALVKRITKFQGRVFTFCNVGGFSDIGFDVILADPSAAPFQPADILEIVYDTILGASTTINASTLPAAPYCGDFAVDSGEQCDDGDRDSCDGCDRDCSLPSCGNGAACAPELCDDGNLVDGDGCDQNCATEVCGNGVLQALLGELCDDGDLNSDTTADACRTTCVPASCGDGATDAGEVCDDAGESATCDSDCTAVLCGDTTVNTMAGEQCDDGGIVDGDGCSSTCQIEICTCVAGTNPGAICTPATELADCGAGGTCVCS